MVEVGHYNQLLYSPDAPAHTPYLLVQRYWRTNSIPNAWIAFNDEGVAYWYNHSPKSLYIYAPLDWSPGQCTEMFFVDPTGAVLSKALFDPYPYEMTNDEGYRVHVRTVLPQSLGYWLKIEGFVLMRR